MKKVVMVSPHFPPDSTAATHRLRILAPHLEKFGWTPIIVTVDPHFYEGVMDPALASMVPEGLRVERVGAIPVSLSRKFRIGDLGLRSFVPLLNRVRKLCREESIDMIFVTIFPSYPALIGRYIRKKFGIPFVLDYQDPWVGEWGQSVGGGPGGRPTLKNRLSRRMAGVLEPFAVRSADGVTAVSERTIDEVYSRYRLPRPRTLELPIGCEPRDFELADSLAKRDFKTEFDDGRFHFVYVGTVLPLGFETIRAFLSALALFKANDHATFERVAVHFFGSSNQRDPNAAARIMPVAREYGLEGIVTEEPPRLDYSDAIAAQKAAGAILLFGSSQPHYTASKLFPAMLSRRPLLTVFHAESTVVRILREIGATAEVVTYDNGAPAGSKVNEICGAITRIVNAEAHAISSGDVGSYSAEALSSQLAAFFNDIVGSFS